MTADGPRRPRRRRSPHSTSQVTLLTDPSSAVSARRRDAPSRSGHRRARAAGRHAHARPRREGASRERGDTIVTAGSPVDGQLPSIFPRGIPIGTVTASARTTPTSTSRSRCSRSSTSTRSTPCSCSSRSSRARRVTVDAGQGRRCSSSSAAILQVSIFSDVDDPRRHARHPARRRSSRSRCCAARSSARVAGFAAGLVVDTANLGTLGLTSLLLTLAGYWIGRYGETTGRDRFHAPFLSVARRHRALRVRRARAPLRARRARRRRGVVLLERCRRAIALNLLLTCRSTRSCRRLLPPSRARRPRPRGAAPWLAPAAGASGSSRFLPPDPRVEEPVPADPAARAPGRDPRRGRARASSGCSSSGSGRCRSSPGRQYLAGGARQPAADGARRRAARADPRPQRQRLVTNIAGDALEVWPADLPKTKRGRLDELQRLVEGH